MDNITLFGIDIAKNVFQVCGVNQAGKVLLNKRLTREKIKLFLANTPSCLIAIEACGGANYWAREFKQLGHKVKVISPQYVKPYVRRNKNDSQDAQAIAEAARCPQMPEVNVKTPEQQDMQSELRVRESLIQMRTQISNQVRGLLAEYGIVFKQGLSSLRKQLAELFAPDATHGLSEGFKQLLVRQYELLLELDHRIKQSDALLTDYAQKNEVCQRLQAVEGIGVITSVAIVSTVGQGAGFKNGRHFAAYLGLVPRQHSSGNKEQLLGISKRGNSYLRQVLIHGARSVVIRASKKTDARSVWITQLKERCGVNKASVALANKNARIVMAMLLTNESYRRAA